MVWALDAARFDRDHDLSLIAHEQTHAILRGRFPEDPRARGSSKRVSPITSIGYALGPAYWLDRNEVPRGKPQPSGGPLAGAPLLAAGGTLAFRWTNASSLSRP